MRSATTRGPNDKRYAIHLVGAWMPVLIYAPRGRAARVLRL
jgi:hypothetical protein